MRKEWRFKSIHPHVMLSAKTYTLRCRLAANNKEEKHKKSKTRELRSKATRKPTKIVRLPQRENCPSCDEPLQPSKSITERTVTDLVFTKNGLRKVIIKYWATKGYCRKCNCYYNPPGFSKDGRPQAYGLGFKVWITYQRLVLRLSYQSIRQMVEDVFDEKLSGKLIINYLKDVADSYSSTEKLLIHRMLESSFVHVDETKINIRGINWFVWVFTDGKHVVFKLTETRETTVVHEILADYSGILISDFYSGYDSVQCKQQKCWVHLIRDLNNDLWGAPSDTEFEIFILEIRSLIIPIMECIQQHGLKKRNLRKFKKQVDKFYRKIIIDQPYESELVLKYQRRFIRYRESLFIFLEQDGIPWHNNTAENAIRHLALQRKVSKIFYESMTHDYLLLLGIRQSCRFQGKSFLKFLLSGEKDLHKFEARKRKRRA